MKKLILLVFTFISFTATAQEDTFTKMLKNYEDSDFATVIELAPEMMGMANSFMGDEMGDMKDILKGIKGMKIIVIENDGTKNFLNRKDSIYNNFTDALAKSNYKSMMNVKDGSTLVKMFSKPFIKGKSKDLVMAIQEDEEVVLIYLEGIINNKDVSKILQRD